MGIDRWGVVGKENSAVAVAQRYTSKVPEDKHETPLLIVHVPGIDQYMVSALKDGQTGAYHVVAIISSPLQQAFAYSQCAMSKKPISPET